MRSKFVPFEFGETMTWAEIPVCFGWVKKSSVAEFRRLADARKWLTHEWAANRADIARAKRKNPSAVALGKLGAKGRARKLTAEQRSDKLTKAQRVEIARGRRKRARGETDTREAPADRAQGGAGERETCALNSCLLNLVRL